MEPLPSQQANQTNSLKDIGQSYVRQWKSAESWGFGAALFFLLAGTRFLRAVQYYSMTAQPIDQETASLFKDNMVIVAIGIILISLGALIFIFRRPFGWLKDAYYVTIFRSESVVYQLFRTNFKLILPFLLSFSGMIILVIMLPIAANIIGDAVMLSYYFIFAIISFYVLGFFVSAELLKRKLGLAKDNFFTNLLWNFYAILPVVIIAPILLMILFKPSKSKPEDQNRLAALKPLTNLVDTAKFLLADVSAYFINLILFSIAFRRKGLAGSFTDSFDFLRHNPYQLIAIWSQSGAGFAIVAATLFFTGFALDPWDGEPNMYILVPAVGLALLGWVVRLFVGQIMILLYCTKTWYPDEFARLNLKNI